jgi:hypothetical protein
MAFATFGAERSGGCGSSTHGARDGLYGLSSLSGQYDGDVGEYAILCICDRVGVNVGDDGVYAGDEGV